MKERVNQLDMTEGRIFSKLVQFSFPLILSSLLQLLFNVADVVVVGHFAGDKCLAAVGSTSSLVNLLVNLFLGLSIGATVTASNYFGAKKEKELKEAVHTTFLLSIYSGLILSVVGFFSAKYLLLLMSSPPDVLPLSTQYLKTYFIGMIPMMVYNYGSALLRSKGDTSRPLYILFVSGLINVVLNLLFVIKFNMAVRGVAYATVISQALSAIAITIILLNETDCYHLDLKKLSINKYIFARILKIGIPAGLQGILFSVSNVIIQSSINTFGAIVIAGNSAAVAVEGFVYTSMNGISQGVLTFISQNIGAKNTARIKRVMAESQLLVLAIGTILGGGVSILSDKILTIFSSNLAVIEVGSLRIKILCTFYAFCGLMDCAGNSVRGLGHSTLPMFVTLIGSCLFRILWIMTIFRLPGFQTPFVIFLSYPISWFLTWVTHIICFVKCFHKIDKDGA